MRIFWSVTLQVDENIACLFAILVGCRILLWVMLRVVAKTRWVTLRVSRLVSTGSVDAGSYFGQLP